MGNEGREGWMWKGEEGGRINYSGGKANRRGGLGMIDEGFGVVENIIL